MNNCRCASLVRISCCLCPRQVKDTPQTYFQPRLGKMVGNRTFGSKLSLSTVTRKLYGTHKFSVVFHASWLPCPIFILFQSCMEVTVTWKLGKFIKLPICPILVGISPEGVAKYSNIYSIPENLWVVCVALGQGGRIDFRKMGRSQCGEQPHVNWTSVREDGRMQRCRDGGCEGWKWVQSSWVLCQNRWVDFGAVKKWCRFFSHNFVCVVLAK